MVVEAFIVALVSSRHHLHYLLVHVITMHQINCPSTAAIIEQLIIAVVVAMNPGFNSKSSITSQLAGRADPAATIPRPIATFATAMLTITHL